MDLSPEQKRLVRHALGLPNRERRLLRNVYWIATPQHRAVPILARMALMAGEGLTESHFTHDFLRGHPAHGFIPVTAQEL